MSPCALPTVLRPWSRRSNMCRPSDRTIAKATMEPTVIQTLARTLTLDPSEPLTHPTPHPSGFCECLCVRHCWSRIRGTASRGPCDTRHAFRQSLLRESGLYYLTAVQPSPSREFGAGRSLWCCCSSVGHRSGTPTGSEGDVVRLGSTKDLSNVELRMSSRVEMCIEKRSGPSG